VWDSPFKTIFSDLYCIARDKEAFVAAHMQLHNDSNHWEVNFTRATHDWELESISTFFDLLYSAKVLGQGEDKICWKAGTTKDYEVRLYYQTLVPIVGCFPWRSTWRPRFLLVLHFVDVSVFPFNRAILLMCVRT
jgi:hypothetical protein